MNIRHLALATFNAVVVVLGLVLVRDVVMILIVTGATLLAWLALTLTESSLSRRA